MGAEIGDHLRILGLLELPAAVYGYLLEHGWPGIDRLTAELDSTPAQVRAALEHLDDDGLVAAMDDEYVVLDPVAALRGRQAQLESQISAGISASLTAYERYRRHHGRPIRGTGVEVLHGEEIPARVADLERAATRELRGFDTAPYESPSPENPIEIDNLRRGVGYRIIYARSSLETPDFYRRNIEPCMQAGELARCAASVPVKMFIVDDEVAMVSLAADLADVRHTAIEVRSEVLITALSALFEERWKSATPLTNSSDLQSELRPIEILLLRQLAIGVTDEAAARTLRISPRTVARYVERLMRISGCSSRFQLAVQADKHGWLD